MATAELELLKDYIAIPSVNPMGRTDLPPEQTGERRYAERVEIDLRRLGMDVELVGQGERLSVVGEATVAGATETILIASHLDTVPVDTMRVPPFDPRVEDGRMYGRGTCDTKAGMAAAITALARVISRGRLRRNVVIVGEADEEATSVGVRDVVAHLAGRLPSWGIATEPTENRLVTHHKGVARGHITASGHACHSSDPSRGVNAISLLCRAVLALDEHGRELAERRDPLLGPATLNVGLISGGQAPNMVPDRACLDMDRRLLPGETEQSVREDLESALKRAGLGSVSLDFEIEKYAIGVAADAESVRRCVRALGALGMDSEPTWAAFGTDAGLFEAHGVPCVVLGPGSVELAHTEAEYVPTEEVEATTRFFEQLFGE